MSFKDKPMKFTFGAPGSASAPVSESETPAENAAEPMDAESTEYTPDELGSALAESIKSGSGQAVYEAIAKIVENCKPGMA